MVLDLLSSSICYLGSGVGQGRPGMGTGFGFFQGLGRLEPDKRWVSMVIGTAIGEVLEAVGQLVGLSMQCRVIAMSIQFSAF